jgi:voltage-gated potassium channel Kch
MSNQKRNWSSTSLLDASVYQRHTKDFANTNSQKIEFFPTNNEKYEDKEGKYIINPEASWKLVWDAIGFTIIMYQAISIPFYIAFSIDELTNPYYYIDLLIFIYFLLDIFICFNLAFFKNGDLIEDRKEIIKNYLKLWFWIDIISTFPYEVCHRYFSIKSNSLGSAPQLLRLSKFYRLLKLLRLAKLKKIFADIEDYVNSETSSNMVLILKLVFLAFFIAHWTGCMWYYVSVLDSQTHPKTWVSVAYFETGSMSEVYVTSLYWAFITMATIGYGDIVPITPNETLFAFLVIFITCGMFAYTIGSIGVVVSNYTQDERLYREKCVSINAFMKNKKIPLDLQFRTRRYLEYTWDQLKNKTIGEVEIIKLLSEPLREEVFVYTRGSILNNCLVFKNFSVNFIKQLAKLLEVRTFAPSDTIFVEGQKSSSMYFIRTGEIELFQQGTGTILKLLKSGKYCGEIALFIESTRCCSANSVDFLETLKLEKKDFEDLIEKNPDAFKVYEYIKIRCEKGDLSPLGINCYLCAGEGHLATFCKSFDLNAGKETLKNKWINSRAQATKFINPYTQALAKPIRKRNLSKYKACNVIGTERDHTCVFKDNSYLSKKISSFNEDLGFPEKL